eukprot:2155032-Rhodomonas_salina.1
MAGSVEVVALQAQLATMNATMNAEMNQLYVDVDTAWLVLTGIDPPGLPPLLDLQLHETQMPIPVCTAAGLFCITNRRLKLGSRCLKLELSAGDFLAGLPMKRA